jgi:hypothetical protein
MRTFFALMVLTACAFAQRSTTAAPSQGACGPAGVNFDVKTASGQPVTPAEAGQASVYVSEVFKKVPGELGNPTIRVGLDGKWIGAVRGNSYLAFSVDPGDHHLCTNWQSHFKRLSREASFTSFKAEAGKAYYFRANILYQSVGTATAMSLDLEPVNDDEGKYLVASNPASSAAIKK